MAYAQQTDIAPRRLTLPQLVQLTDDTNSGQVNVAVVADALSDASGIIEMHCRERYALPLFQTNELTALTVDIAVYKLYTKRPGKMPAEVLQTYKDALGFLTSIAAKKISLDQPIGAVDQAPSAKLAVSTRPKVFSNSNLEGFTGRKIGVDGGPNWPYNR